MVDWFAFAVLATLSTGVQNFVYKVAAEKGCNSATLMSSFLGTLIVLSGAAVFITGNFGVPNLWIFILFVVANAALYLIRFIFRQEALKYIPLVIGLPLMKMSAAVAALIGVIFLGEKLNALNSIGIILSLAVAWILTGRDEEGKVRNLRKGLLYTLIVIAVAASGNVVVKFASAEGNHFLFMVLSYGAMFFPALLLQEKFSDTESADRKTTLKWGAIIGAINFVSFSSLLSALEQGPMSIVFPMTTIGMAISVALSIAVLKEELTVRRAAGIALALIALILLRL